ncbi:hypothetical protein KP509_32G016500 [Ceratopteris richardii]|uniref:Uncharacterized protein n=1 Tax=Ceratopteris richardii TaxID=49495 RepID=A0A8T2QRZ1_CERRI|nr:hypothetical protein KP509_32G016500 [Ceratopteris richardii]
MLNLHHKSSTEEGENFSPSFLCPLPIHLLYELTIILYDIFSCSLFMTPQ